MRLLGAQKMNYAAIETRDFAAASDFYNLTAAETVREQVFNCNYEDALNTMLNAYQDVFKIPQNGYKFRQEILKAGGTFYTIASQSSSNKFVYIGLSITRFDLFAYSKNKDFNTFGLLTRALYHEYIHAWDFSGSGYLGANSRFILVTSDPLAQFRALYLSTLSSVRLPTLTITEIKATYIVAMSFYNGFKNDESVNTADKNQYLNWYNTMSNYINGK